MIISTTSNITKTKVKEAFIPYWKKETGTYLNIIQLDEPTMYLEKIDPKVKSLITKSNNELEQRFSKEELEGILHSYETDELPEHRITKEASIKVQEMCDIAEILHKNVKIPVALGDAGALNK